MKRFCVWAILCSMFFPVAAAQAAEKNWSDEAEFALVDTGGNTEVTTLAAKNLLKLQFSEQFSGQWELAALYGETEGTKTAESYLTRVRGDYVPYERLFYFATLSWQQNEFSGIDSRYVAGAGTGYKFMVGPLHHLVGEAGLTYTVDDYSGGTDDDYLGGRLYGAYRYQFNESNSFEQKLEFLPDFEESKNWLLNSETALIAALDSRFSMKTSYQVNYDHDPLPGVKKTDRILAVALLARF